MDVPVAAPDALIRPWRRATIVASLVAGVELVVLVVAGVALLAKPLAHAVRHQAEVRAFAPVRPATPQVFRATREAAPTLTRAQTNVLVLNGNGRTGAASIAADRLRTIGYAVAGTANAPRRDYASTVVMYRAGFRAEGLRLARDLHLHVVGPLDGLRPRALMGAHLVLVLGLG